MSRILALTIHQPWAWCIVAGVKDFENRDWKPPADLSWVAIHAGVRPKTKHSLNPNTCTINSICRMRQTLREEEMADVPDISELDFGAIVGAARIAGIHERGTPCDSPWRNDAAFGWRLADAVKLERPIPCKGKQGLWALSGFDRQTLRAAVMGAR